MLVIFFILITSSLDYAVLLEGRKLISVTLVTYRIKLKPVAWLPYLP